MSKVEKSVAISDIDRWLEYKKVSDKKREANSENIETLVSEVEEGRLVVDDKANLIYQLKFPILDDKGNPVLSELTFKPRMRSADLDPYLKGIKATDVDSRVRAHVCALTKQSMSLVAKMDTEDTSIGQTVAVFFI